jgi:Ca-activated chloride channel family protein
MNLRFFKWRGCRQCCFMVLACILAAGMISCSSQSSQSQQSSSSEEQASPTDFSRLWIEQETAKIPIPADIGGQADLTRNFYFIMDGSGSMREPTTKDCGGDQRFIDKISGARWAIKKFLENVPADVNIGLYIFDRDGSREVVPLGKANRECFLGAVDKIDAGGGTPLARAIQYGADQLAAQYKKQLGYGEFRLVVVTDGIAENIPQAALYAAKYGIPIYAIGLCVEKNHPLRQFSVSYQAADSFADLSKGLSETLAELPVFDVTQFDTQQ